MVLCRAERIDRARAMKACGARVGETRGWLERMPWGRGSVRESGTMVWLE